MLREVKLPQGGSCTQFFQLDFKHFLGSRSRIDADSIAIPGRMKEVLESIKGENPKWDELDQEAIGSSATFLSATMNNKFEELIAICGMAFRVLRRSNGFVMHFVKLFTQDSKLVAVLEQHLTESLCLGMNEDAAVAHISEKVRLSSSKWAKLMKDVTHSMKDFSKRSGSDLSLADLTPGTQAV